MRRVIAILLLVLFVTTNSGTALTVHFCHGRFSNLSFGLIRFGTEKCQCKKTKGCCNTKPILLICKTSFQKTIVQFDSEKDLFFLIPAQIVNSGKYSAGFSASTEFYPDISPPDYKDLIIQNQVFRI